MVILGGKACRFQGVGLRLTFGVLTGVEVDVLPQDMHHANCMCALCLYVYLSVCS